MKYGLIYHDTQNKSDVVELHRTAAGALRSYRGHLRDGGHGSTHSAVEFLVAVKRGSRLNNDQWRVLAEAENE